MFVGCGHRLPALGRLSTKILLSSPPHGSSTLNSCLGDSRFYLQNATSSTYKKQIAPTFFPAKQVPRTFPSHLVLVPGPTYLGDGGWAERKTAFLFSLMLPSLSFSLLATLLLGHFPFTSRTLKVTGGRSALSFARLNPWDDSIIFTTLVPLSRQTQLSLK